MTFDEKISETISLSRILDSFLEDEENPEVVISYHNIIMIVLIFSIIAICQIGYFRLITS